MTRVQMLTNFPKVFKGTHVSHPLVSTYRGARVELESLDPSMPMDVYADGERVGPLPGHHGSRARRAHRAGAGLSSARGSQRRVTAPGCFACGLGLRERERRAGDVIVPCMPGGPVAGNRAVERVVAGRRRKKIRDVSFSPCG